MKLGAFFKQYKKYSIYSMVVLCSICCIILAGNAGRTNPEPEETSDTEILSSSDKETVVAETKVTEKETVKRTKAETESEEAEAEEVPKTVTIVAIGDMLMHPGVSGLALKPDGSRDYSFIFEPIGDDVREADIAVVNNEVPFGGNQYGLKNYPQFNVYSELGDAEAAAGFDIILNATNHVMDMGTAGALNTLDFWKNYPDIVKLGLHESADAQYRLDIIERNGIRIALFNYTYGLNAGASASRPYLVDLMTQDQRDKIREEISRAEREADFTIVFPHWGEEYQLNENGNQHRWAELFTECGADLIIGTHPHCLEPVKTVTAGNGNTSLCYYSLGNYISMQDETMSVLGGLAKITLIKEDGKVRILDNSMEYLVTHYEPDVSFAFVRKIGDYTQDLVDRHAIKAARLPGNNLNVYYPFELATLYRIIDQVNGGPRAALSVPDLSYPILRPTEEEETEETVDYDAEESEEEDETSSEEEDTEDTEKTSDKETVKETASEGAETSETGSGDKETVKESETSEAINTEEDSSEETTSAPPVSETEPETEPEETEPEETLPPPEETEEP